MPSKFLKPLDPALRKTSQEISQNQINSKETNRIAEMMIEIIDQQRTKRKKGVGLAGPQIGIFKRIILVDTSANGKTRNRKPELKIFINPEIIWFSKSKREWYEGCFSTGQICGIVSRSASIKVKAFRIPIPRLEAKQPPVLEVKKYTGYVARIFQHEIDHLNGKVFVERITDPNKLHKVFKKEFPLYRKTWKKWPKKYPLPLALVRLKKV